MLLILLFSVNMGGVGLDVISVLEEPRETERETKLNQ